MSEKNLQMSDGERVDLKQNWKKLDEKIPSTCEFRQKQYSFRRVVKNKSHFVCRDQKCNSKYELLFFPGDCMGVNNPAKMCSCSFQSAERKS